MANFKRSRKWLYAILGGLFIMLIAAAPVYAYLYRSPITITESNGNDYDILPVIIDMPIDWLVDNGFTTTSTALDTRIETYGGAAEMHMVADNKTLVVLTSVDGDSQVNRYFSTGNTPLDSFPVIVGDGGYITITGHGNLELGNDFEVEFEGWVATSQSVIPVVEATATSTEDTQQTSHNVSLPSGIESGDLLLLLFDCYDPQLATPTITWPSGWTNLAKESITARSSGVAYKIATGTEGNSVIVTTGSASGYSAHKTFRISHYLGTPKATSVATGSVSNPDSTSLSPSWGITKGTLFISFFGGASGSSYTVSSYPSGYWGGELSKSTAGYAYLGSAIKTSCPSAENPGQFTMSSTLGFTWAAWTVGVEGEARPILNKDGAFYVYTTGTGIETMIDGSSPKIVTASGLDPDEYTVTAWADGANFGIDINGSTEDTEALGGVSVPSNANNWILSQAALPYFNCYTHVTSDTLRLTYEPDDIIIGTTLPNELNPGTYDGTITWGTNPVGITVDVGSMVSSSQPLPNADTGEEDYRDTLPEAETTDWFVEPDVSGTLQTNPLRPFVTIMSDTTSMTELQAWRFFGLLVLIFLTGLAAMKLKGHLFIAGVTAAVTIAVLIQQTIWPFWTVVFAVAAIVAGLIAERQPQI